MRAARAKGLTLVEMVFFGALAALLLGGAVQMLARGSRLVESSRRTSNLQTDLRVLLETLAADVEELAYLEEGAALDMELAAAGGGLKFVVFSARVEPGLDVPASPSYRRVEYGPGRAVEKGASRRLSREVTLLGLDGEPASQPPVSRSLPGGLGRLRVWPLAAVPVTGGRYQLAAASDPRARQPGAAPACMVVEVAMGGPASSAAESAATSMVTKLWCRSRLMALADGGGS